jgi:uncharacterized membrane protein (DUF106 family)
MLPEWLAAIPASTFFILGISALMAFLSSLVNRFSMSEEQRERLRALRREAANLRREWMENRKAAKETGDKKLLKKVQKQEKRVMQLQSQMASMSLRQMKVYPITLGIFLLMWLLITGRILAWELFTTPFSEGGIVAYLPWFGDVLPLDFFYWYLLCSFLFGTIFSRVFGLTVVGGSE